MGALTSKKILVVEDNEMNLLFLKKFMDKWDADYKTARNGKEALDSIAKNDFDLVIMDLYMPVMDGYEAVKHIREQENGGSDYLPVIALSAQPFSNDDPEMPTAGFSDFLIKPFQPEKFL